MLILLWNFTIPNADPLSILPLYPQPKVYSMNCKTLLYIGSALGMAKISKKKITETNRNN